MARKNKTKNRTLLLVGTALVILLLVSVSRMGFNLSDSSQAQDNPITVGYDSSAPALDSMVYSNKPSFFDLFYGGGQAFSITGSPSALPSGWSCSTVKEPYSTFVATTTSGGVGGACPTNSKVDLWKCYDTACNSRSKEATGYKVNGVAPTFSGMTIGTSYYRDCYACSVGLSGTTCSVTTTGVKAPDGTAYNNYCVSTSVLRKYSCSTSGGVTSQDVASTTCGSSVTPTPAPTTSSVTTCNSAYDKYTQYCYTGKCTGTSADLVSVNGCSALGNTQDIICQKYGYLLTKPNCVGTSLPTSISLTSSSKCVSSGSGACISADGVSCYQYQCRTGAVCELYYSAMVPCQSDLTEYMKPRCPWDASTGATYICEPSTFSNSNYQLVSKYGCFVEFGVGYHCYTPLSTAPKCTVYSDGSASYNGQTYSRGCETLNGVSMVTTYSCVNDQAVKTNTAPTNEQTGCVCTGKGTWDCSSCTTPQCVCSKSGGSWSSTQNKCCTATGCTTPIANSCKDTDGDNPSTKGSITFVLNSVTKTVEDVCDTPTGKLIEYLCTGTTATGKIYTPDSIHKCADGALVSNVVTPECTTDTDCGECKVCYQSKCYVDNSACQKPTPTPKPTTNPSCSADADCGTCSSCVSSSCVAVTGCIPQTSTPSPTVNPVCSATTDCGTCQSCINNQCLQAVNCSKESWWDNVVNYFTQNPFEAWGITALSIVILVLIGVFLFGKKQKSGGAF